MTKSRSVLAVLAALSAAALLTEPPARSQDAAAPPAPPGVEVQARGPIHEAYAESAGGEPRESPVVMKEPPPPIDELPPDEKPDGDNVTWMPGYWGFDDAKQDFMWISGFWRSPPPNRRWVPGHWKDVETGGWQWIPGFWGAAEEDEVSYLPPPPAPIEMAPPPPPSPDHVLVPGCWVWRDDHYAWRPAYYIPCRPDWIWVPAHYVWTPCGHVFVDGYWDYTLKDRGLLFSPVAIDRSAITVGFVYTPCYAVHHDTLCGCMFVRPGCRCYFYGDYFDPGFTNAGYVSWCSVSGGYRDPMFAYYQVQTRNDPQWSISLNLVFNARYKDPGLRPPVVINATTINIINNQTTIINNNFPGNRFFAAAAPMPVAQLAARTGMKMTPVPMAERQAHAAAAHRMVEASHARAEAEKRVLAQGPPPRKLGDKPRSAKLDLPKAPPPSGRAATVPPAHSDKHAAPVGQHAATPPHPATTPPNHALTPAPNHPAAPTPAQNHPGTTPTPAAHTTPPAQSHPAAPTTPAAHAPAPAQPGHPAAPATPAAHAPAPAQPGHPAAPATPAAHVPTTPTPGHPATATPGHPTPPAAHTTPATTPGHPAPGTPPAAAGQGQQPPTGQGQQPPPNGTTPSTPAATTPAPGSPH